MNRSGKRKPGRLMKSVRKYWDLYLLLVPVAAYFILFQYLPMYGLQIAFKDYSPRKGYWGSPWVGFEHFIRFLSSYNFWQIMYNTVSISVLTLIFTFPLPIMLALLLNETRSKRFKGALQTITYTPHFLSTVVVVGMMVAFVSPSTGIINQLIRLFGGQPVYFMTKPEWFKPLYIISDIWKNTGWSSIIFVSALSNVDLGLYEAAKVDGANRRQRLFHITFPCLAPTMIIMLILSCGKIMGVGFEKIFLMQTDLTLGISQVISTYVYQQGIVQSQFSYATAVGIFDSLINFAVLLIVNRIAKKASDISLW